MSWEGLADDVAEMFARLEVPEIHEGMTIRDGTEEKRSKSLAYYYAHRESVLARQRIYKRSLRSRVLERARNARRRAA